VAERIDGVVGCGFGCDRDLAAYRKCNQIREKCMASELALENIELWNCLPAAQFCI
jgi:hypothetical protein